MGGPAGDQVPEQQGQHRLPARQLVTLAAAAAAAGYKVGEKLYFIGASQTWDDGKSCTASRVV